MTIRNVDPIELACESHVPHYRDYAADLREAAGAAADSILWVGGGPGFSLFAQEFTEALNLNVGVVGPGESVMLRLCKDPLRSAEQRNVVVTGTPDPKFSTRVMDYDPELMAVYASKRSAMIGVETRRKSCYQGCTYCPYAHITKDDWGAERDIPALLAEVRAIHDAGIRQIFFTDAIFNADIRYAKKVVAALNSDLDCPGLRWSAYFTPKPFDREFAALLAESDVEYVVISPDSLHPGMMNEIGKSFGIQHVDRCLELCREFGLKPKINVVLGGPNENEDTARATLEYINQNLEPQELVLHIGYRVLPETAMSRQTETTAKELLEPTFLHIDPEMFGWLYKYLDSKFLKPEFILNAAAAKRGLRSRRVVRAQYSVARKLLPLAVQ
ncbi:hypothetical protein Cs7R123_63410 [Catellatospora sp. TT07R-123]|nr:hypothetical protein Cs7R123_63410 [Catellatospora sp. TT07R-123]